MRREDCEDGGVISLCQHWLIYDRKSEKNEKINMRCLLMRSTSLRSWKLFPAHKLHKSLLFDNRIMQNKSIIVDADLFQYGSVDVDVDVDGS